MRETLKRLAKLTAGYSLITLLGPLFTIALTPLYTRVLTPADYGVVDVALTVSTLLGYIAVMGLDQTLSAYFFDDGVAHQRNLYTTAIVCVGGLGLLIGIGLAAFAVPLAQLLFKDPGRQYLFYLVAVNCVCSPIYVVTAAALRLRMGVKRVNALGLSFLVTAAISNLILIVILRFKATGVVAANVITQFIIAGLGLWLAWRPLWGQFSQRLLKPLVRTGLSLAPAALTNILFLSIDRVILTQFVTQTELGLYSIANKIMNLGFALMSAAWMAWWPMALEMASQPDSTRQYARMFDYFIAGTCGISLGLGIFAPEVLSVFTRAIYVPAAPYALALLISSPFNLMASFFQIGLYVRKRTGVISLAYASAAVVNIVLNLVLDPVIGVWGAVIATVIASIDLAIVIFIYSQRVMPVPYPVRHVVLVLATYLGLAAVHLLLPEMNTLVLKLGTLIAFSLSIIVAGVVSPAQIRIAIRETRRYLARHLLHRSEPGSA